MVKLNTLGVLQKGVIKMESDIPKQIQCPVCGYTVVKSWIWHGIRLYECQQCKNTFTEGEANKA